MTTILTCHTEGCGNADIAIPVDPVDMDGNPAPVGTAVCGACGNEITDIKPEG